MKKDIHPENYRKVIFHDNSCGAEFLIESAIKTEEEAVFEGGAKYPLYRVEISSASHPFYTGKKTVVDTAGRVQKFQERREKAKAARDATKTKGEKKKRVSQKKKEVSKK